MTIFVYLISSGDSLGKSSTGGLTAPIPISVKTNRGGLGRDALVRDIKQRKEEMVRKRREQRRNQQQQEMSTAEYRSEKFTWQDFRCVLTLLNAGFHTEKIIRLS